MLVEWRELTYLAILLIIGCIILFLRRKAKGSKSLYKLVLVLSGILIATFTLNSQTLTLFDNNFLKDISIFLLIVLMFELSIRLNPENITFRKKNIMLFFTLIIMNFLVLGILTSYLLNIDIIYSVVFAIIMSSIEYFMVDELKEEGDMANPLLILFAFSILFFYHMEDRLFDNAVTFIQYLLIGLGTGVAAGIIVFKSMRHEIIGWFHEIGLVAVALALYIITEYVGGSGLFAILILGVFFGNSFIRKRGQMVSFSPFIFKTIEVLAFLLVGFVAMIRLNHNILLSSLMIFVACLIIRFVAQSIAYKHYSIQNKLLLTFAPKGMVFAISILVLGSTGSFPDTLISVMLLILVFSLIFSIFFEYYEEKKISRLDRVYRMLKSLRFGRKSDLKKNRINLFNIFKTHKNHKH
jgi:cell volume regulation protein A